MNTRTITFRRDDGAGQDAAPPLTMHAPAGLADLLFGAWAVTPDMLAELHAIYEAHVRGPKIDVAAIEARLGRPLANKPAQYELQNGVAVLPVQGVIAPKANLFMQVSGGMSAQQGRRAILDAGADAGAKSVLLAVDSPGGNVLGIPEWGEAIREVAARKPVVTLTDGQMASGGYWLGSAANHVFATGPTVQVGSIGVLMTHKDVTEANAREGVKVTHFTAGKYKALGSPHVPLTKDSRAAMQASVDYLYSIFVDAVAAHRGVSAQVVLERMADGIVFHGQQSLDAGLVDGFSSFDALLESMATDPAKYAKRTTARIKPVDSPPSSGRAGAARADASPAPTGKGNPMAEATTDNGAPTITVDSVRRDHTAVYAAIFALGAAGELARATSVRAQLLPGHEALIESLAIDGKTTGPEAAAAVIQAERGAVAASKTAHEGGAPKPVAGSPAPSPSADDESSKPINERSRAAQNAAAQAYAKEHKVDILAACEALGIK